MTESLRPQQKTIAADFVISADTNILVRLFVADDPDQSVVAERLLRKCEADNPLYINIIVVVELVRALRKVYKRPAQEVRLALLALCESYNVHVEHRDLLQRAIAANEASGAEIADFLIAALNRMAADAQTMTFDRTAAERIEDMELLS